MKHSPFFLVLLMLITACAGGKSIPLVDEEIVEFIGPNYQEIFPGQEDGQKLLILTFPAKSLMNGYTIDSVYFQGYHEPIQTNITDLAIEFRAKILVPNEKVEIVPPYPLLDNEALLSYRDDQGKRKLFKVKNILRKEPIFQP